MQQHVVREPGSGRLAIAPRRLCDLAHESPQSAMLTRDHPQHLLDRRASLHRSPHEASRRLPLMPPASSYDVPTRRDSPPDGGASGGAADGT